MKKVLAIFFAILSLSLILISCGDDEKESKYDENYVYDGTSLVGKWQESVQNDEFYQVYDISEDKIILTSYSFGIMMQEITATYHVEDNNTLVVAWGDGYVDRNKFSITNDKTVVITQVIASSTSEMELVPYNLEWNKDNSKIVGTWQSNDYEGETFTFRSNYTLYVEGEKDSYTISYATKGNTLTFGGEFVDNFKEEVNVMTYEVKGNTLTLTGVGENNTKVVLTFTKV